jgi:4'-phosphopantetheinyl transferase
MPLYSTKNDENFSLALWRIEEDLAFFEQEFNSYSGINHKDKRLQWYASRHLANTMRNCFTEIEKDEHGNPFVKGEQTQISITHSYLFAGVMLSDKADVGMDLEPVNPKVLRIGHKFITQDELAAIHEDEKIEKLILYWSAKEALYKLYGKRGVDFKSQLLIEPFQLNKEGLLHATIKVGETLIPDLKVHYNFFEDHVLTYVLGR